MDISEGTRVGRLTDMAVARARAEAREVDAMIRYRDTEHARIDQQESPLRRQLDKSAIPLEIGQAMGFSEAQVQHRLAMADRIRERAPRTWLAFRGGRIDLARLREISATLDTLERSESWLRLDLRAPAYAQAHTTAELRRWLRDFVQTVEADLALERAERARADRRVEITQGDDGMAALWALLPAPAAAAIDRRLTAEAKALLAADPDDTRTLAQVRADLLAAWLTTNEAGQVAVHADIAVTVPAETATGAGDGFAQAADGSWTCPASWIFSDDFVSNPVWHRLIVDPVTHDVLAHDYIGRFAPDKLAKALEFRDGVCQAPGCLVPAHRCDLDHRRPWPDGPTSGTNMWPLCRRHHNLKGHQIITWTLPSGRTVPAKPARHDAA